MVLVDYFLMPIKIKIIKEMQKMLRKKVNKHEDWLPAVKVYGEGIFLELNEEKLNKWEEKT